MPCFDTTGANCGLCHPRCLRILGRWNGRECLTTCYSLHKTHSRLCPCLSILQPHSISFVNLAMMLFSCNETGGSMLGRCFHPKTSCSSWWSGVVWCYLRIWLNMCSTTSIRGSILKLVWLVAQFLLPCSQHLSFSLFRSCGPIVPYIRLWCFRLNIILIVSFCSNQLQPWHLFFNTVT